MDLRPSLLLEMLKTFRNLLLLSATATTVLSLTFWLSPLSSDDTSVKALMYSGGLIAGIGTISLSKQIERYSPIFTILKKADDETFTHLIATEIYEQKNMIARQIDLPLLDTDELVEIVPESVCDTVPVDSSEIIPASLLENVKTELNAGTAEHKIIKQVLRCSGRKYKEGRKLLDTIKGLLSSDNPTSPESETEQNTQASESL